jgi:hypothetical protein
MRITILAVFLTACAHTPTVPYVVEYPNEQSNLAGDGPYKGVSVRNPLPTPVLIHLSCPSGRHFVAWDIKVNAFGEKNGWVQVLSKNQFDPCQIIGWEVR